MAQANIYMTPFGEVKISQREADRLQLAADAREFDYCGDHADRIFGMEAAIVTACNRFARHKMGGAQ